MGLAHGTVKHFGLHRFDHVELRVVADDEAGILRIEQAEIDVVSRLSGDPRWQHKTLTLFVLSDLQPLQRQLELLGLRPADVRLQERDELLSRPVLNVYDLASPATCNVFVNRKAMIEAKYWEDSLALEGLFAHEHAHPLAECAYTAALRALRIEVQLQLGTVWAHDPGQDANWAARSNQQVGALVSKLFSTGAREVFTNSIAVAAGFDRALYHLNRENIANLGLGLKFRPALAAQLANVVAQGQLSPAGADMLRLIGDMQAFLPLTMEIAPFKREHCGAKARELVKPLHGKLLPQLERPVAGLFDDLVDLYTHADEAATAAGVCADVARGLARLAQAFAAAGALLAYKVEEV